MDGLQQKTASRHAGLRTALGYLTTNPLSRLAAWERPRANRGGPSDPVVAARWSRALWICALPFACACACATQARDPAPETREISASPDDLSSQVTEGRLEADAILGQGLAAQLGDVWRRFNDGIDARTRLRLGLNYTAVLQAASAVEQGDSGASGGDFEFFGQWSVVDRGKWPGSISFLTELRHRYTSTAPADLGANIGSLFRTTTGFGSQAFALSQLYWDHGSFEAGFRYRIGKIDPALTYDSGRYVSDNYAFLNQAFSDTAAMALPGPGLGATVVAYPHGELYAMAGVQDANGRKTNSGFDTIGDGELFAALELGWTPKFGEPREGAYHMTFWHSDRRANADVPSGRGFALTAEQQLGPDNRIVPFVRYSYGTGAGLKVRQVLAVGAGFEQILGQNDDLIGVGAAWGQPADRSLRDEYVFEAFYRFYLTPNMHISPDVQLIVHPSRNPEEDFVAVLGLRFRLLF